MWWGSPLMNPEFVCVCVHAHPDHGHAFRVCMAVIYGVFVCDCVFGTCHSIEHCNGSMALVDTMHHPLMNRVHGMYVYVCVCAMALCYRQCLLWQAPECKTLHCLCLSASCLESVFSVCRGGGMGGGGVPGSACSDTTPLQPTSMPACQPERV